MSIDLDLMIRHADPANDVDIPDFDSLVGRRVWARVQLDARSQPQPSIRVTRRRAVLTAAAFCLTVVIVATLVSYEFLPIGGGTPFAQAALLQISRVAAQHEPDLTLNPGQWLTSGYDATAKVSINPQDPIHSVTASITGSITTWTNANGVVCLIDSYAAPEFSSSSDEQTWLAAGLHVNARSDAQTCSTGPESGAVDVSRLPTDPHVLASQLISGTTGIPALDSGSMTGLADTNAGFQRALELLVGPITGNTGAFYSTLVGAMAYIPGITDLGVQSTTQGATGEAFSAKSSTGHVVAIISPSTGQVLEVQNSFPTFIPLAPNLFSALGLPPGVEAAASLTSLAPTTSPTVHAPPQTLPANGPAAR